MYPIIVISSRAKKRLKGKHPWIFSNEIESKPNLNPGDLVRVQDQKANFIGLGYYNPHTLIAVRLLSEQEEFHPADQIRKAFEFREKLYQDSVYRLVYGESDGLPGLIIDRYGQTLVAQILTAGMERMRDAILAALLEVLQPARILLRNDSEYRKLEQLPLEVTWVHGQPLDHEILEIDGLKFWVDYAKGQKTGFFLDQRENRRRLAHYAHGQNMLDAFSYSGAWALYGIRAGMKQVFAVDGSQQAIESVRRNAALNDCSITTVVTDVFEFLRRQYSSSQRYDVIILDPPAFCKSKRHLPEALKGYREINLRAMKLLARQGILFTCSCSQPVTPDLFVDLLRHAAADSGRNVYLRELLFQPPDHPVRLGFPESHYLKCAILQTE